MHSTIIAGEMTEALCGKCEDPFTDPRILPCLHTFCLKCLQKLSENTNEPLQCPTCDEKVPLPNGGVLAFPKDQCKAHDAEKARLNGKIEDGEEKCDQCVRADSGAAVAFCIQCSDFLCEACRGHHRTWRKTLDHEIIPTGERLSKGDEGSVLSKFRPQPALCSVHSDEKLKYYCRQCRELICRDCMGSKVHKSHSEVCVLVEEVAEEEMKSLKLHLSGSQTAVAKLDSAIDSCRKTTKQVKVCKDAVDGMIASSLERVRDTLLKQNATICDSKVGILEAQERELVRIRKGLAHASHLINESSMYVPDQQLSTKDVIATRIEELLKEFQSKDLDPLENDTLLTQVAQQSTITEIVTLCQVSGGSHAASSTFGSVVPPRAYTGRKYTMKIVARDGHGTAMDCGGERVEVKIGRQDGTGVACTCTDNHDGTYTAQYNAEISGQHDLHATIAGRPIKCSPLTFTVKQPRSYATLSSQTNIGTFASPWDVAVADDGSLLVAEYGYHTVSVYNKTTKSRVFYFGAGNGMAGSGSNQLHSPIGVAVRGDTVYVVENGYNRIKTFSISRKQYQTAFGSGGSGDGQFSNPRGICVDSEGKVFIADYSNHRVQVFKDGIHQYSISGDHAVEESKLQYPWGVAFDPDGNLHIAAYGSHSIKVYTPQGAYITTYGSGTVSRPAGMAINGEGVIAISENGGSNRLWIYDYDRKKVLNTIQGVFSSGTGIACDDDDMFWVVGNGNNCIYKF